MAINKTKAGTFEVDFRDQYKKRHLKTFSLASLKARVCPTV
jgi:hypothetical protein